MTETSDLPAVFCFGQTVIVRQRRELTHAGQRIEIGGRAFDLLIALVEAHGTPVSRDALRARVWPGRVIEDNTIEARISVIRRALGDDRDAISTIEGLGYQFVAEFTSLADDLLTLERSAVPHSAFAAPTQIRYPSSALVGREQDIAALVEVARTRRLITMVGAGGVGKSRLAIEVTRALSPEFPDGVFHAEFAGTESQEYVVSGIAATMCVEPVSGSETLDSIADVVGSKRLLLVLDNCEHLIDSVAVTIEQLLSIAPRLTVIATSREALRINGEYVFRVAPLELPSLETYSDPRASGALQLLEQLVGDGESTGIPDSELTVAAEICRRLDGIPLAIELAAACVPALGFVGVAQQLDDRFWLLTRGARTALPRHQSLLASLDWSYNLLDAIQQTVLERVSLFAGRFTLEAAQRVVPDVAISVHDVLHALIGLEQKSLVNVSVDADIRRFSLLETTRVYARSKLQTRTNFFTHARSHAEYILNLFVKAERDTVNSAHGYQLNSGDVSLLDELEAAVQWGFEPGGDTETAIDLVIASAPFSIRDASFDACLVRVDKALQAIATHGGLQAGRVVKLQAARGTCLLASGEASAAGDAFNVALRLAEELDNVDCKMQSMWGRWCVAFQTGKYAEAARFAKEFGAPATAESSSTVDSVVACRLCGVSDLSKGNLTAANDALHAAEAQLCDIPDRQRVRFLFDEAVLVHCTLALVTWYRGRPLLAAEQARRALACSEELRHTPSIFHALHAGVCRIAWLTGDMRSLELAVEKLQRVTRPSSDTIWKARANMWGAFLAMRRGDTDEFERVIVPSLNLLWEQSHMDSVIPFTTEAALLASRQGKAGAARQQIDIALTHALAIGDLCSVPELQRVKAELLLESSGDASTREVAVRLLLDACKRSTELGCLGWHLRCATSLSRLWRNAKEDEKARAILAPVYGSFEEGYDTMDLRAAREVMQTLA